MIKFIGCVFIIISGAGIGCAMSEKLNEKCRILKTIVAMLEDIKIMLDCECLTTNEIVYRLSQKASYRELGFFDDLSSLNIGHCIADRINKSKILCEDDKIKLSDFFKEFGSTDINGQITKLEMCKQEFVSAVGQANERYLKYSKLYRAMGVLCGAFAAIMLV